MKPPAKVLEKKEAAAQRERLRGLSPQQADDLRRATRLIAAGDLLLSGQWLLGLSRQLPDHPEVLRWCGVQHARLGEWPQAIESLTRATAQRPDDAPLWRELGTAYEHAGDNAAALQALRRAAACSRGADDWLALSLEFDRQGHYDDSLAAIEQVLALAPQSPVALLQRSRCHKALGDAARAAADCRTLIDAGRETARAWFSLVDLKTVPLSAAELARLERSATLAAGPADERLLLEFALGKALEDAGRFEQALAVFHRANRHAQATHPWQAQAFDRQVAAVRQAFAERPPTAARAQGGEVIFLVGLPRSGTTLVEQVLASHSRVEGASELPYLNGVIEEESRRRGRPFPDWVGECSADDWTRLGQRYLQLSVRWRTARPVSTDKLPENWLLAGAAFAMLPQARVVDCRRDAVETCWSCYKQLFGPGRVGFTYDLASLAANWHAYDRLCGFWAERYPAQFHTQRYETLVAEPEREIRALLAFCGLPFEPGCLTFHTAQRAIRTPSALQVRQPMRRTSTPAAGYGALLDPLRLLLQPPAPPPAVTPARPLP